MDVLTASLFELVRTLDDLGIQVVLGGGFGLYLRRRQLIETGERTLFVTLPEPRATNDLDLFLRAELIANFQQTKAVADAIRALGYTPVETAKYLQWEREVEVSGVQQRTKIDVLVGPLGELKDQVRINEPRVRPKGNIQFHAHLVEEAIGVEESPVRVTLRGQWKGESQEATVHVPGAFPYLMMKLHAFADRMEDANKDLGRHHALDLYTIVGMMTEPEYNRARALGQTHARDPVVMRAQSIVKDCFIGLTATGIIRVREHKLFRPEFELATFIAVLREIFLAPDSSDSPTTAR